MSTVNFNQFNQYSLNNPTGLSPVQPQGNVNQILTDLFQSLSSLFDGLGSGQTNTGSGTFASCGCTSPPLIDDSSHPSGTLKTEDGVITTPGGYQIEPMGKFEWKITGSDGKSTRIWGDPHVAESDGGKWDFKRDSTFMLPDGTKINVTTKPWKSGKMTVTGSLEIINGNDRVIVSDVDKGKGVIGPITGDGFAHANSFGKNDVFVMGKETDDWSFTGKEIIGSNNGGTSFKLGNDLAAGVSDNNGLSSGNDIMKMLTDFLSKMFGNSSTMTPSTSGINGLDQAWGNLFENPNKTTAQSQNTPQLSNVDSNQKQMQDMFKAMADMFDALSRLTNMNDMMQMNRSRNQFV